MTKTRVLNQAIYETYIDRKSNGTIKQVLLWDGYNDQLTMDMDIKKINGVLMDSDNDMIKQEDLKGAIYKSLRNLDPKIANQLYNRVYDATENTIVHADKKHVVFLNGRYNIKEGTFELGSFDSINKIRHNFVENATSALGIEVMGRYIGDNIGFDTQVFEAIGLLAAQDKDFGIKKSIFFNGEANTGKSFLFERLIEPAIGRHNVGRIDFSNLDNQEVSSMINKTAAYDSDMGKGKMNAQAIEKFKKITGDTTLTAKILYKDKMDFDNYATAWINCNGLPMIMDRGSGGSIDTRIHVIQATVNVRDKYNDPLLGDKLEAVQDEVSEWLLFNAMKALTHAVITGKLTVTEASRQAIDMELTDIDTVEKFMNTNPIVGTGPVKISDLYDAYKESFEIGKVNSHDISVGKINFARSIRDMANKLNYRVYKSHGQIVLRIQDNLDPVVRNRHGDMVRQSEQDARDALEKEEADLILASMKGGN